MNAKINRLKDSSGFTLIEIIASIAILGMVIAVFSPIFPQIISWTQNADTELSASNLLGQAVEDVKNNEEILGNLDEFPDCEGEPLSVNGDTLTSYEINGEAYHPAVSLCQTDEEKTLQLVRAHIQILSEDGDPVSESYTYIKGDANETAE
ncbi:type II secretion system protein [Lentibacillus sediminis]|uniref:type II secretion system protein n=1 Tax=Lentibacillus sediminis TaxID=1940529 RepID=UPI001303FEBB|nr:type II secretion system protein [Lentibacillus sediminis]